MKKTILLSIFLIFGISKNSFSAWSDEALINRSSFTITNDTLVAISSLTMAGGVLCGVIVSSSTPSGSVTFYDSVAVKTSTIGIVSMAGQGSGAFYIPFEVRLSSGLTYTVVGNSSSGISIIYKNLRPGN